jgi:hypothetical protein
MQSSRLAAATLVATAHLATAALAQPAPAAPPEEAARRLEQILGRWASTWEWLDANGKVLGVERGSETGVWAIEGRLVELTTLVEGRPGPSKAWMFWSEPLERFTLVSVGADGTLWTLAGGLEEFVLTSEPTPQPDGRTMEIRISHGEETADRLSAVMEYRHPPAEEWTVGFRQTLVRAP